MKETASTPEIGFSVKRARIVDLSYPVQSGMQQRFPSGPIPTIFDHSIRSTEHFTAVDDSSVLPHHLGTHLDAQRHYNPTAGAGIEQIPLNRLIVDAVVLDLTSKAPRSEISADDLERAAVATRETVLPGDAVLLHTGMDQHYAEWRFDNMEGSRYVTDRPYLSDSGVDWLIAKEIALIGVDTLQPDSNGSYRPVHQRLLRDRGIPILENLTNLSELRRARILLVAAPVKVVGASGYPVRAVAVELP